MLGIDISNHQGAFNWEAARADHVTFAWVKATEGRSFIDGQFVRNMREARKRGIPIGAYHYARPDNNRPRDEVDHFLRVIGKPWDGDLLPVLDFEHPSGLSASAYQEWALAWLEEVEKRLGVRPIFYSYPSYMAHAMGGARRLRGYPLWLADYGRNDGERHALGSISRSFVGNFELVAHQFTSNGRVAGEPRIDLNHATDLERLRVRYEPVPPPKPQTSRPLPGPRRKPKWFWAAVKEYLARRRGKA